jgi:hypothetical protein
MALIEIATFQEGDKIISPNESLSHLQPIMTVPGCRANLKPYQSTGKSSWYNAYIDAVWPRAQPGSLVGVTLNDISRIVSYDQMNDKETLQKMKDYFSTLIHPVIWENSECILEASLGSRHANSINRRW